MIWVSWLDKERYSPHEAEEGTSCMIARPGGTGVQNVVARSWPALRKCRNNKLDRRAFRYFLKREAVFIDNAKAAFSVMSSLPDHPRSLQDDGSTWACFWPWEARLSATRCMAA